MAAIVCTDIAEHNGPVTIGKQQKLLQLGCGNCLLHYPESQREYHYHGTTVVFGTRCPFNGCVLIPR